MTIGVLPSLYSKVNRCWKKKISWIFYLASHLLNLNKAISLKINSAIRGINIHLVLPIFKKSTKEHINILYQADLAFPNLLSNGKCHRVSGEKSAKFSHLTSVFELQFLGDQIPFGISWTSGCYFVDLFPSSFRSILSL